MKIRLLALGLLALSMSVSAAMAAPSCGMWNWQTDGSYFQVCVNDDGSQHCYKATDSNGANAYEVSCSS